MQILQRKKKEPELGGGWVGGEGGGREGELIKTRGRKVLREKERER